MPALKPLAGPLALNVVNAMIKVCVQYGKLKVTLTFPVSALILLLL